MKLQNTVVNIDTGEGISIHQLNDEIKAALVKSEINNGFVIICSRHTTTALTINEYEARLLVDIKDWLRSIAPEEKKYLHNDIHLRDCPQDEPENAHSHLMAMLLGSSEAIPVCDGVPALGQWQSVMLLELDGPRQRKVNIQVIGE